MPVPHPRSKPRAPGRVRPTPSGRAIEFTRPMLQALADVRKAPVVLVGAGFDLDRWVNVNTRRALQRRGLVEIVSQNQGRKVLRITDTGELVINAYVLGTEHTAPEQLSLFGERS